MELVVVVVQMDQAQVPLKLSTQNFEADTGSQRV